MITIAAIVGVMPGYCPIDLLVMRLNTLSDANCQSCMKEGEVEPFRHFLLYYPTFATLTLKYLGEHIIPSANTEKYS